MQEIIVIIYRYIPDYVLENIRSIITTKTLIIPRRFSHISGHKGYIEK